MKSIRLSAITILAAFFGALLFALPAQALPQYAIKEGKTCAYCHFNPNGGGPRNYRGVYYARHNHSFAGFSEISLSPPKLSLAWQEALATRPTRVAEADTDGKGLPLLLLVNPGKGPDDRVISVESWDAGRQAHRVDGAVPVSKDADLMEAGRFAPGAPAIIVMPSGYVQYTGADYVFHPGQREDDLLAAFHVRNGNDVLLTTNGAERPAMHTVDTHSTTGAWLITAADAPPMRGPQLEWSQFRGAPEQMARVARYLRVPGRGASPEFMGMWNPKGDDQTFLYLARHRTRGQQPGDYVVLYPTGDTTVAWQSPALPGTVIDIAPGPDIRGGKGTGLYVLTAGKAATDPEVLSYFVLQPTAPGA